MAHTCGVSVAGDLGFGLAGNVNSQGTGVIYRDRYPVWWRSPGRLRWCNRCCLARKPRPWSTAAYFTTSRAENPTAIALRSADLGRGHFIRINPQALQGLAWRLERLRVHNPAHPSPVHTRSCRRIKCLSLLGWLCGVSAGMALAECHCLPLQTLNELLIGSPDF